MKVLQEGLSKSQAAPEEVSSPEPPAEEAAPEEVLDPREARRRAELAELEEIEKQAAAIRQTEMEKLAAENAQRQAKAGQKNRILTQPHLCLCAKTPRYVVAAAQKKLKRRADLPVSAAVKVTDAAPAR